MKEFAYAILAALLVAAVAHARTIVLPVQPVAVDASGAEEPAVFVPGALGPTAFAQSGAYMWWIDMTSGATVQAGCHDVANMVWTNPCPVSTPTWTFNFPLHVELR